MKKASSVFVILMFLILSYALIASAAEGKMGKATGKVTAVDFREGGIVIDWMVGGVPLTVGAIVGKDTVVKVGGKTGSLDQIKEGDTITLEWVKSTDIYAKEIIKK